jgi:protein-tyrosine-phosphatase
MAEAILRSVLDERGVSWQVWSEGFLEAGHPMVEEALATLGPDGAAMASHLSRTLSVSDVREADIVLGMTREHVREVVVLVPEAWGRTFTLKEFVRRSQSFRPWFPPQSFTEWLAGIHQGRERQEMQGYSAEDDVADPIGGTPAEFDATARLLRNLCGEVADRLSPQQEVTWSGDRPDMV